MKYVTENGVPLGRWLAEIGSQLGEKNACRSSLEERQLERLREIGFKTEKKTVRQWNEKYALAKNYYEEYGN